MKFAFNQKLKELRIKKNVTQEQLAGHLRISPQAVSKWERGEGYPDIMLLPRIALYFGVSIDELLGIDEERIREQIEKWKAESQLLQEQGEIKKDAELWERAYGEYPSEPDVMFGYMVALANLCFSSNNIEKYPAQAEKAIELGDALLEKPIDVPMRNTVIQFLAILSDVMRKPDDAKKYADMTSGLNRDVLLGSILHGDEGLEHSQKFIIKLTDLLAQEAWSVAGGDHSAYCTEERIRIFHYILGLFTSLFTDGDYGFYAVRMSTYSQGLAKCYAKISDRENCLRYLNDAVKFARMSDEYDCRAAIQRTSLLLNRTDTAGSVSKNYTDSVCTCLLNDLKQPRFDFIREDPEFVVLLENLMSQV